MPPDLPPIELLELVPRDKQDHERAAAAIGAGYPAVAPVLPQLLEWLQDMNWPVAQHLAPFIAGIGKPLIPHVRLILESEDSVWKYWIIGAVLLHSRELAEVFRSELVRIAYRPTAVELDELLSEQAERVLNEFGWKKEGEQ